MDTFSFFEAVKKTMAEWGGIMRKNRKMVISLMAILLLNGIGCRSIVAHSSVVTEIATGTEGKLQTAPEISEEKTRAAGADEQNEGPGFDTPEEALLAFVEGLQNSDLDQMISTFAVESYCMHYDMALQMKRLRVVNPYLIVNNGSFSPMVNDLITQTSVEARRASIAEAIKLALIRIAADHMTPDEDGLSENVTGGLLDYNSFPLLPDTSLSDLNEVLIAIQNIPDFYGMNVSEPIPMTCFSMMDKDYLKQSCLQTFFDESLSIGADGFTDRGIILKNEEEAYLLTVSAVKYGDKWFNYKLGGNIGSLLTINPSRQGFIWADFDSLYERSGFEIIDGLAALYDYIQNPDTDEAAMLLEQFGKTETEFDQEHQSLLAQLQSGKDTEGNNLDVTGIDFSKPLISQMPALKQAYDDIVIEFADSAYRNLAIMSFDELKTYFALD